MKKILVSSSHWLFLQQFLNHFKLINPTVDCNTVTSKFGNKQHYFCEKYQYCCAGGCCEQTYAVWYLWVLLVILLFTCCFVGWIVKRKRSKKNRQIRPLELLRRPQQHGPSAPEYPSTPINHMTATSTGIGAYNNRDNMTPIGGPSVIAYSSYDSSYLFVANAPPPYTETDIHSPLNRDRSTRPTEHLDAPPSYNSIFS